MIGQVRRRTITPRPWLMLAVMVLGQAATTVVSATPAFLIPYFLQTEGMSLAYVGLLAGAPNVGLVLSLFAWGAAADRYGERRVLLVGLALTVLAVAVSTMVSGFVWLGLAFVVSGAMSACINNASGRLITGWFAVERRGFAMGIRQTCQPIGMAIAAIAVPSLASHWGLTAAIGFGGVFTAAGLLLCVLTVVDPKASPKVAAATRSNPYRDSRVLVRIHAVSLLLVVPQFVLSTFGLVWFTLGFGWSALAAGTLVAVSQLLGAVGRIVVGSWSDKLASRLRPLRYVAAAGIVILLLAAGFGWAGWALPAAVAYVIASCVSVADNGLAFTSVAEIAGPQWAGRALGVQNTGQFLGASIVPPLVGGLIGLLGIPGALAIVALTPAIALRLIPSESAAYEAMTRTARGAE